MKSSNINYSFIKCFVIILAFFSCQEPKVKENISKSNYISVDSLLTMVPMSDVVKERDMPTIRKYYPTFLEDSIQLPIIFDLELFLEDIVDFKTNKSDYLLKTQLAYTTPSNDLYFNDSLNKLPKNSAFRIHREYYKTDSVLIFSPSPKSSSKAYTFNSEVHSDGFFSVVYEGNQDDTSVSDVEYDGKFYYQIKNDSVNQWSQEFQTRKFLNWRMHDYPFDVQKLKLRIASKVDTTIVRFNESKDFPGYFSDNLSLPEGYQISSIDFEEKFIKTNLQDINTGKFQHRSIGEFTINIKREGISLFIKLFLGAFLSLLLSISVFFIPMKEFDAKAQLSVGAIFAAVGNKYFVDSSTLSNVLTASDVINNLVILIVIFNVFVIIAQRSERLNFYWLEKDVNAIKLSVFFTVFIMAVTILFFLR